MLESALEIDEEILTVPSDQTVFQALWHDIALLPEISDNAIGAAFWLACMNEHALIDGKTTIDAEVRQTTFEWAQNIEGDASDAALEIALRSIVQGRFDRAGAMIRKHIQDSAKAMAADRTVRQELAQFYKRRIQGLNWVEDGIIRESGRAAQRRERLASAAESVLSRRSRPISSVSAFVQLVRAEMVPNSKDWPKGLGKSSMHSALTKMIRNGRISSDKAPLKK